MPSIWICQEEKISPKYRRQPKTEWRTKKYALCLVKCPENHLASNFRQIFPLRKKEWWPGYHPGAEAEKEKFFRIFLFVLSPITFRFGALPQRISTTRYWRQRCIPYQTFLKGNKGLTKYYRKYRLKKWNRNRTMNDRWVCIKQRWITPDYLRSLVSTDDNRNSDKNDARRLAIAS